LEQPPGKITHGFQNTKSMRSRKGCSKKEKRVCGEGGRWLKGREKLRRRLLEIFPIKRKGGVSGGSLWGLKTGFLVRRGIKLTGDQEVHGVQKVLGSLGGALREKWQGRVFDGVRSSDLYRQHRLRGTEVISYRFQLGGIR